MALNLDLLRWRSKVRGFSREEPAPLPRRQFLRGSAVVALAPDLSGSLLRKRILFHRDGERASLLLDGEERWAFTPDTLAGARLLVMTHTPREILLAITGGHYPGSSVPLDLTLHARRQFL